MKFLTRIAVLFFVTLIMFLSAFVIVFTYNLVSLQEVLDFITIVYYDEAVGMICAAYAGVLLFLNFVFYQVFTVNIHRDKTIAFDNPAGRVSVSLLAIEELTKRVISRIPEVREVKSRIQATKKGLQIKIRLILRAEGSIPEVTSKVQELVKKKIQDTIGLDDPIDIAIYVGKILPDQGKKKKEPKVEEPPKEPDPNVPFQGYRA